MMSTDDRIKAAVAIVQGELDEVSKQLDRAETNALLVFDLLEEYDMEGALDGEVLAWFHARQEERR
jgi:hypothetical protein